MFESLLEEFARPGSNYRGAPFWAWNGKLEPEELRRQIRLLQHGGLGGFFMHSRVGLDTAYLSDEWFDCVGACIDEAKALGMQAWLYDEDRWPSGAAGGLVTKHAKYQMRSLYQETLSPGQRVEWTDDVLAAFTAKLDGSIAGEVVRIPDGEQPGELSPVQSVLVFTVRRAEPSDWYNGQTYLDTLNPKAVGEFIHITHEAYAREFGKHFGKTVPGIFTDEPNHGHKIGADNNTGAPAGLPWTDKLPAVFRKRYKYDLIPHLVELYYDVDGQGITPPRHDYHDCVTHLFVDAFSRQIGEWCDKHNLLFTGHVLEEDSLSGQTNVVGSAMRFYEYMQAPGMDLLTEHWRVYTTAKQVSSAARQFGRKWRLTETYGCTGWDFPFLGHKALGDWQAALGINLRAQHLAWYTMAGEAKRDYPAAVFYQSPWWRLYPKVENYFARIFAVMTQGEEVRDLLVIHPVESMWVQVRRGWQQDSNVKEYDRMLVELEGTLLGAHLDFDYGDEEILSVHAKVAQKKGKARLVVGEAAYTTVVVPPLITMRATTLALLQEFRQAGGTVIFVGEPAGYVDAAISSAAQDFALNCVKTAAKGAELAAVAAPTCRRISLSETSGQEIPYLLYLLREDRDACYLFVCNTGDDVSAHPEYLFTEPRAVERTAVFPAVRIAGFDGCKGQPLELDPDTGKVYTADAERDGDGWVIHTAFPALGSRLFVIPKKGQAGHHPPRPRLVEANRVPVEVDAWPVALSESNVIPLDRPRYRIGDGEWQGPEEILRVDRQVRAALGLRPRGGAMVQPWARKAADDQTFAPVDLVYTFTAETLPGGDLFLAVEHPERYCLALNGVLLNTDMESGWWTDRALRKIPIDPALIAPGANELVLSVDYTADFSGLEIIYLLGNFGANVEGTRLTLTPPPAMLSAGDWGPQGLPFYAGSVVYHHTLPLAPADGERVFLQVPDYRGAAVRVFVNGAVAGIIAWEPNEVEITPYLAGDTADLRIEVIGHRRNSHGPFHLNEKWPTWTGPGEFVAGPERWHDGYQLVPCGLMAAPVLVTRKE